MPRPAAPQRPPPAPDFQRRVNFDAAERIGVPLLLLLPLLALAGVFDQQVRSLHSRQGELSLHISYPAISRLHLQGALAIDVHNHGSQPLNDVQISVEQRYLRHFDQLSFLPGELQLDGQLYRARLKPLAPGQSRRLLLALRPQRAGLHEGHVFVQRSGSPLQANRLRSFIYP